MGARFRGVVVLAVVLGVGAFLGSSLGQWWSSGPTPGPTTAEPGAPGARIRVEVLNGGGVDGLAHAATEHLRERGYDVVFYGNAPPFDRDSSMVLDRVGRPGLARAVADAMGIRRVRTEPDSNLYLDVTVVLGKDWTPAPDEAAGPTRTVPWWDLRRLFDHDQLREDSGTGRMADPGEEEGT